MTTQMYRGDGTTTRQMLAAPQRAVYVWPNGMCRHGFEYPVVLARDLGREDLQLVSPSYFDDRRWQGQELTGIVIDHATQLTDYQRDIYRVVRAMIRVPKGET